MTCQAWLQSSWGCKVDFLQVFYHHRKITAFGWTNKLYGRNSGRSILQVCESHIDIVDIGNILTSQQQFTEGNQKRWFLRSFSFLGDKKRAEAKVFSAQLMLLSKLETTPSRPYTYVCRFLFAAEANFLPVYDFEAEHCFFFQARRDRWAEFFWPQRNIYGMTSHLSRVVDQVYNIYLL